MLLPPLPVALRARPWIGLDLEPPTARLLAGHRRGLRWRVDVCSSRALPPACLQDGRIVQFEPLVEALRAWLSEEGLAASPRVALALSGSLLRRQRLAAPQGRPWRWRPWLQAQAERLAQAPLDEITWAVQLLPGRPVQLWLSTCPWRGWKTGRAWPRPWA